VSAWRSFRRHHTQLPRSDLYGVPGTPALDPPTTEAPAGSGSGGSGSPSTAASAGPGSSTQSAASLDDVEPADDPSPAQGSHEVPSGPVGAFFYELFVVQGGSAVQAVADTVGIIPALAISSEARAAFKQTFNQTRVQPLAERLVQKAELRIAPIARMGGERREFGDRIA